MPSVFTKIINGEIPSFKILEDDYFYAFLDIEPLQKGHTLVVPKLEVDKFYELEDGYLQRWLIFAKPIIKAIEKSFDCQRVGMSFVGLEVPHAHMHLIPINKINDMNFLNIAEKLTTGEMQNIQNQIILNL